MKFKNLERYRVGGTNTSMSLSVPLSRTPLGRTYRYSPNEDALPRHFVIGAVVPDHKIKQDVRLRMKLEPRSNQTVCPYSGTIAADEDFTHPDDVQASIDTVTHAAHEDIRDAFEDIFRDLGRKHASSKFISFKPGERQAKPKPHFVRGDLLRERWPAAGRD